MKTFGFYRALNAKDEHSLQRPAGSMLISAEVELEAWAAVQEKVLAQVEEMHKKNPPKPKAAKPLKKEVPLAAKAEAGEPAEDEDEEEEEEDPVEAALNKYGIITENPWEKGVK